MKNPTDDAHLRSPLLRRGDFDSPVIRNREPTEEGGGPI